MNWIQSKIKAGALQFVLFIGTLVAVLLFGFLMLAHIHNHFGKQTSATVNLIRANANFLKAELRGASYQTADGVIHQKKASHWGLYEHWELISTFGPKQWRKRVLVGQGITLETPALWIADAKRPIVIAGNARIYGNAYLPEAGIRMGSVSGHGYTDSRLVFGKSLHSKAQLPKLHFQLPQIQGKHTEKLRLASKTELVRSFNDPTVLIEGSFLSLDTQRLSGNIIVWANTKIKVGKTAYLQDVILIAPKIEVEKDFKGSFQAFAQEEIKIGSNVELYYPSALVVNRNTKEQDSPYTGANLHIDSGAYVSGAVIYQGIPSERVRGPKLKINENAQVKGQVYCTDALELKGLVMGTVYTQGFVAIENGTTYQNHLYNGVMDISKLPMEYAGLTLNNDNPKAVVKWLY